jgi:hypothetical protein
MNPLPQMIKFLFDFILPRNWKGAFFYITVFSIYSLYTLNENLRDSKALIQQIKSENDQLKIENNNLRSKLGVLGQGIERYTGLQKNVADFKRDWDMSSFYLVDDDTFCPRKRGDNNYQRIFYKYDTPLTASDFNLKFQMVDQDEKITEYTQRILAGLEFGDKILSEFDIPTRNSQIVNFRIASDSGSLISGGPGKPISSPINDKSIINLKFRTQFKSRQEITEFIDLDYFSSIPDYGDENKTISYDAKVNDSRPETAKSNIFIGSYFGGCIKVIDWHAS